MIFGNFTYGRWTNKPVNSMAGGTNAVAMVTADAGPGEAATMT